MSVSLVSAPVLCFDLVRHPAGQQIAELLLNALNFGPQDLLLFTPDPARGQRREVAWQAVRELVDARGRGPLPGSMLAPAQSPRALSESDQLADDLVRSMIINLDDLDRLIRSDVLLWTSSPTGPRATMRAVPRGDDRPDSELVQCAGDAIIDSLAAYWIEGLDVATRAVLCEPIQLVLTQIAPREPDVGPRAELVGQFLAELSCLDDDARTRLRAVADLMPITGAEWADAVHEASWAALTTGRIRAAAAAQLLGSQAFRAAGFTAVDGAEGLWNTISGHIQAEVLHDVLPATTYNRLTQIWHAALAVA